MTPLSLPGPTPSVGPPGGRFVGSPRLGASIEPAQAHSTRQPGMRARMVTPLVRPGGEKVVSVAAEIFASLAMAPAAASGAATNRPLVRMRRLWEGRAHAPLRTRQRLDLLRRIRQRLPATAVRTRGH